MTDRPAEPVTTLTLYWRQHCPYCVKLRWRLHRTRLPVEEINIWENDGAAARVREITGGDETVPTVVVGSQAIVNPTMAQIVSALRTDAPHLLDRVTTPARRRVAWILAPVLAAIVWGALALWHPTVTYHLAPALVAAAAPVVRRLETGPMRAGTAIDTALGGLAVSLAATAVLAGWHALAGPTVTGGRNALGETLLMAVVGAAGAGWGVTLGQSVRMRGDR